MRRLAAKMQMLLQPPVNETKSLRKLRITTQECAISRIPGRLLPRLVAPALARADMPHEQTEDHGIQEDSCYL
jgi:hypothetical protein